jgi:hypothetical protein
MAICSSVLERSAIYAAVLSFGLAGLVAEATAQDNISLTRLKTSSATVADALSAGARHSATFRHLLAKIEETDGIVYIEEGTCLHSVRACLLHVVAISGANRLLQIRIEPRKARGCWLVAAIGHELYHAMEVLSDSNVRDGRAMFALFGRLGPTAASDTFETRAAVRTGLRVEREACRDED